MDYIIKRTDNLGRIVLPMHYRLKLGITENTKLSLSEENGTITISVAEPHCKLCGKHENLVTDLSLCKYCIKK